MDNSEIIAGHLEVALRFARNKNNATLAYLIEMAMLENDSAEDTHQSVSHSSNIIAFTPVAPSSRGISGE